MEEDSSPPWALRVPNYTKPRSYSDTTVFDVNKIPVSKSSPDFTRQTSENSSIPPLLQIQEDNVSAGSRTSCTLPIRKERSSTQLRPKSHTGSERALEFIFKFTKSDIWERASARSPRIQRKARNKSNTVTST